VTQPLAELLDQDCMIGYCPFGHLGSVLRFRECGRNQPPR
jgi:hypothetical protein